MFERTEVILGVDPDNEHPIVVSAMIPPRGDTRVTRIGQFDTVTQSVELFRENEWMSKQLKNWTLDPSYNHIELPTKFMVKEIDGATRVMTEVRSSLSLE